MLGNDLAIGIYIAGNDVLTLAVDLNLHQYYRQIPYNVNNILAHSPAGILVNPITIGIVSQVKDCRTRANL